MNKVPCLDTLLNTLCSTNPELSIFPEFKRKRQITLSTTWHSVNCAPKIHEAHFEDFKKCMLQYMTEDEFQFRCQLILHYMNIDKHVNSYSPDYPGMRPEFVCFMNLPKNGVNTMAPIQESSKRRESNKIRIMKFIKLLDQKRHYGNDVI